MRKLLRGMLLALMLLCMGVAMGCDENRTISSLSVSIGEEYATLTYTGAVPTYNVQYSSKRIPLTLTTTPSSFSFRDFDISSNADNVCYITSDGYLVTRGEGSATLRVSYKDSQGKTTSYIFRVNVLVTPVPKFPQQTFTLTYDGADHIHEQTFKVDHESQEYEYTYLQYINGIATEVNEIKNAGEYSIKYHKKDDSTFVITEMSAVVSKASITLTADSATSTYLDTTVEGFCLSGGEIIQDRHITSTVGEDNGKIIGQYALVTSATSTSPCGNYSTSVRYTLNDDDAQNYDVNIIRGTHTITPLSVFLVLEESNLSYGEEIEKNRFSVYNDNQWTEPFTRPTLSLDRDYFIRKMDLSMREYTLKYNDSEVMRNVFGHYDVLPDGESYQYTIKDEDILASGNIIVTNVVPGLATFQAQDVTIDITTSSNGKRHLERDNITDIALNLGDKERFARELQSNVTIDYGEGDYGEGNRLAPVGEYYFKLTNTDSTLNFHIALADRCTSAYSGADKVSYTVSPAVVSAVFGNISQPYQSGELVVNYHGTPTTKVDISSLTVNGENYVQSKSSTFDTDGYFIINDKEKIRFTNSPVEDGTPPQNVYKRYVVTYTLDAGENIKNFALNSTSSTIDLLKQDVYFTLNSTHATAEFSGLISTPDTNDFLEDITLIGSTLSIDEVVKDKSGIMSLTSEGKYYVKPQGGTAFITTTRFGNAGEYKVFQNGKIKYNDGMEYINLIFDATLPCYFTINKMSITIVPDDSNTTNPLSMTNAKIYGSADGDITFTVAEDLPVGEDKDILKGDTSLGRERGENVNEGGYRINLGNLSFRDDSGFENYIITLSDEAKYYKITPRTLKVVPYSPTLTYGAKFPIRAITASDYTLHVEKNGDYILATSRDLYRYFPNIELPDISQFRGEFQLSTDGKTIASKVAGEYPVGEYKIILAQGIDGGFEYTGLKVSGSTYYNYEIVEDDTLPTCRIDKRSVLISFTPTGLDSVTTLTQEGDKYRVTFDSASSQERYSLTNLLPSVTSTSLSISASINSDGSLIYAGAIGDITPTINVESENVTDNYSFSLATNKKSIYVIASEMISIELQSSGSNAITLQYNGEVQTGGFEIVITSANSSKYTISKSKSQRLLETGIIFTNTNGDNVSPLDADSYNVSLNITDSTPLVIENTEDGTTLEFTSFTAKSHGCVIEMASLSSLTITKADVNIRDNKLVFDGEFVYGMDTLPHISLYDADEDAYNFTGVDDTPLMLRIFEDGLNYEVMNGVNLALIGVGERTVTLKMYVAKFLDDSGNARDIHDLPAEEIAQLNMVLDTSYNAIQVEVQIDVQARTVYVDETAPVINGVEQSSNIYHTTYSGRGLFSGVKVTAHTEDSLGNESPSTDYAVNTEIYSLTCHFDKTKAVLDGYAYNSTTEEVDNTAPTTFDIHTSITSVEKKGGYCIINNSVAVECSPSSGLLNSGAYLVFCSITPKTNFALHYGDSDVSSIEVSYLVDIGKNDTYISLYSNPPKFYHGTQLYPDNRSDIIEKFAITLTQNYYDDLTFSITGSMQQGMLSIGSYTLHCIIDVDNYYLEKDISFNISQCRAEIADIPTKAYQTTGEEIDDFLQEIRVTMYDYLGNPTSTYTYSQLNPDNFTFTYVPSIDPGLTFAKAVNVNGEKYVLEITYSDDGYATEEPYVYMYRILPLPYDGPVECNPTRLTYDPTMQYDYLYTTLRSKIKVLDKTDDEIAGIDIFLGNANDASSEENCALLTVDSYTDEQRAGRTDEELKEYLLGQVMRIDPNAVVSYKIMFTDTTIADRYITVSILVTERVINDSDFTLSSQSILKYTGYAQYQGISYSSINLSPYSPAEQYLAGKRFSVTTTQHSDTKYSVTLKDSLSNDVVTVNYIYSALPIVTGDYAVSYTLESGANYSVTKIIPDRTYSIIKADRINISVSASNVVYTGENINVDYTSYLKFKDGTNFITVNAVNDKGDDVKFNISEKKGSASPSSAYSQVNGLSLYVGFTKAGESEFLTAIKDSGDYILHVFFNRNSSYTPQNHFNSVVFNSSSTVISAENVKDGEVCTVAFTVEKASLEVTLDNIGEYVNYTGTVEHIDDIGEDALCIEYNSHFSIKEVDEYTLSIYYRAMSGRMGDKLSGSFAGLSTTEEYLFFFVFVVPKDNNVFSGNSVLVRVHFEST